MKLKYYLRGIGIGVIVATLIMTVSSVIHNNNLSDEVIIKEALKLGMIMPESTEGKDSLWGEKDTESTQSSQNDDSQSIEDTQSENTQATENTQSPEDTQSVEDTQSAEDTQMVVDENMGVITVEDGDAARHVSEKLKAAGIIENAEEFRAYLSNNGYASRIRNGTYVIPKGSTYEEICDYIIK